MASGETEMLMSIGALKGTPCTQYLNRIYTYLINKEVIYIEKLNRKVATEGRDRSGVLLHRHALGCLEAVIDSSRSEQHRLIRTWSRCGSEREGRHLIQQVNDCFASPHDSPCLLHVLIGVNVGT